ncbi:Stress response protein nst1 [Coemansia sp. IMI 209127]|nr:Stress response protein nst1 [Coemansia sp. IMI 209127]
MNGAPRDGMYKSDYMSRTEVDLQRLFYTRLVYIMTSHGFKENSFTEEDVVSVMLSRGLMKSSSDDPVLALASELNDEMTEIVYTNMKQVVSSAIESGRMPTNPSDQTAAVDGQAGSKANALAYNDVMVDSLSECDGIMKLMQSHSLHDSTRSIATMSLEASITHPNIQPVPTAQQPASTINADDPTSKETATSKRKKKRGKRKGKNKVSVVSSTGVDDDASCVQDDEDETDDITSAVKAPDSTLDSSQMDFPDPKSATSVLESLQSRSRMNELRCSAPLSRCRDAIMTWDLAGRSVTAPGSSSAAPKNNRSRDASGIWSNADLDEQKGVRKFWMSLHETERQGLLLLEKHAVASRIRDHQNFSCPCNVCTRKREAIGFELMSLYDAYYKNVQRNTLRERLRDLTEVVDENAESVTRLAFFEAFEKTTEAFIKRYANNPKEQEKAEGYRKLMTFFTSWRRTMDTSTSTQQGLPDSNIPKKGAKRRVEEDSIDRIFKPDFDDILNCFVEQDSDNLENPGIDVVKLSEKVGDVMASCVKRMYMLNPQLGDSSVDPNTRRSPSDRNNHNNTDIFYTDTMLETADYFPTDSKKFFDMMERLAEYHMREEDNFFEDRIYDQDIDEEDLYRHVSSSIDKESTGQRAIQSQQGLCPDCHGEIREHDGRRLYPDTEERDTSRYNSRKRARSQSVVGKSKVASNWNDGYADDDGSNMEEEEEEEEEEEDEDEEEEEEDEDDYADVSDSDDEDSHDMIDADMHLGDTDDELDESDSEVGELEAEAARNAFQLFAARLFEQRVVEAYREKLVQDRQRNLIEELDAEEKRSHAKDKRKQKRKQREKERKRQIQQQREEEKLAREAQACAEKERKKETESQRLKELDRKKQEEAAKARKVIEERNRRVLEEADRRLERERHEKLQREQERLDREERKARERVLEAIDKKGGIKAVGQRQHEPSEISLAAAVAEPFRLPPSVPSSPVKLLAAVSPVLLSAASSPVICDQVQTLHRPSAIPPLAPSIGLSVSTSASTLLPASPSVASSSVASFLGPGGPSTGSDRIPLLDSLQHMSAYTPRTALSAQRPSLPTSASLFELPGVSPTIHSVSPQRARSNSGTSFMQASSGVPISAPAPAVVSLELDAEISSIVGRVMGSSTLQDDLTEGAEWRTKPTVADRLESPCVGPSLNGRSVVIAKTGGASSPLLDMSVRRNSAPLNKATSASAVFTGPEALSNSLCESPVAMDKATEGVYLAYCALEKFRCDKTQSSRESSSNADFGGFHSVVELSQMHGRISDRDVWTICAKFGQANPSACQLNHANRFVAFALNTSTRLPALRQPQQQPQQPTLSEDMLNAFSLHPCSPLLKPHHAQSSTATPVQGSIPPAALASVPMVASSQLTMQPFSHQTQQQPGLAYSPVAQQSPTSLFFSQLPAQTVGGHYSAAMPYSLPPFQSSPLNSAGFGQYPQSSINESPITTAALPLMQQPLPMLPAHSTAGLAAVKSMPSVSSEMWSAGIPGDNWVSQPQHRLHNQQQQQQQQQPLVAPFHALNMPPQQSPRLFEQHPQQRQQQLQQWQ